MSWKHFNTETETLEISGYLPTELERFHAVVMVKIHGITKFADRGKTMQYA